MTFLMGKVFKASKTTYSKTPVPFMRFIDERVARSGGAERVQQQTQIAHGLGVGAGRARLARVSRALAPHARPPARQRHAHVQDLRYLP